MEKRIMASLHIKCFGPIVDSTKIDLTPLMVLIDRQSADKSAFILPLDREEDYDFY
jgi:predicted ATPase